MSEQSFWMATAAAVTFIMFADAGLIIALCPQGIIWQLGAASLATIVGFLAYTAAILRLDAPQKEPDDKEQALATLDD